jgi:ankyrin repeat protein
MLTKRVPLIFSLICAVLVSVNGFSVASDIHDAVRKGDLATIKKVLQGGTSVNEIDEDGNTLLHKAVREGHLEGTSKNSFFH